MKHWDTVAEDKRRLIIKLNPEAFIAKPHGTLIGLNPGLITFNTMYSHKGKPLGPWFVDGVKQKYLRHNKGPRPFIEVGDIRMEAGPTMIYEGADVLGMIQHRGGYQSDIFSPAQHQVFGVTAKGKVVLGFYDAIPKRKDGLTLKEVLVDIKRACTIYNAKDPLVSLINCDGGDKAHMFVAGQVRGLGEPLVGIALELK
jgi:hypothetical protein